MHLKQSVEENLSAFPCQSRNDMQLNGKDLILKKKKNESSSYTLQKWTFLLFHNSLHYHVRSFWNLCVFFKDSCVVVLWALGHLILIIFIASNYEESPVKSLLILADGKVTWWQYNHRWFKMALNCFTVWWRACMLHTINMQ